MIAIDFGLKKIGIAWCANGIILPLPALQRKNRTQAARDLSYILKEKNAKTLIIGVANDETKKRIEHFVGLIKFGGNIKFIDETLSSKEAQDYINGRGNSKTLRKNGTLDSISAMIIMQRYIDSLQR